MTIRKDKHQQLQREMDRLGIYEDDLIEKFILGSGPGGQKIQKSHSTVYLKHIPTGIEIKCGRERSRELNRFYARRELCEQIKKKILGEKTAKEQKAHKIRMQKKRRSRRVKQKILEEKKYLSAKKALRSPLKPERE